MPADLYAIRRYTSTEVLPLTSSFSVNKSMDQPTNRVSNLILQSPVNIVASLGPSSYEPLTSYQITDIPPSPHPHKKIKKKTPLLQCSRDSNEVSGRARLLFLELLQLALKFMFSKHTLCSFCFVRLPQPVCCWISHLPLMEKCTGSQHGPKATTFSQSLIGVTSSANNI